MNVGLTRQGQDPHVYYNFGEGTEERHIIQMKNIVMKDTAN